MNDKRTKVETETRKRREDAGAARLRQEVLKEEK